MSPIHLRRIDDGRRITIESAGGEVDPRLPADQTAYDAGFRRIAAESEVPRGRARIFETGGAFILVVRAEDRVSAFNAEPLMRVERTPHLALAQQFVIERAGDSELPQDLRPLPVTIEDGSIWANVEEGIRP